jgi:hypothetical protein
MSPIIPIAIGGAVLYGIHQTKTAQATSKPAGTTQALDPGMDANISEAVTKAISQEKDQHTLQNLSDALARAGFTASAAAVAAHAKAP